MSLAELLTERDLIVDFAPGDKWQAIGMLVQHLVESGRLPSERKDEILQAVYSRERSLSTGLEHGVAIPHAAVDGLQRVLACVGVVRRDGGLAFESVDGRPTFVVVLLLIPRQQKLVHIRTLKEVALALGRSDVRERVLAAATPGEAYRELIGGEKKG
jgi:PTS system fructose-specific IIA component/PTS system nitrogen regulatory IIA component